MVQRIPLTRSWWIEKKESAMLHFYSLIALDEFSTAVFRWNMSNAFSCSHVAWSCSSPLRKPASPAVKNVWVQWPRATLPAYKSLWTLEAASAFPSNAAWSNCRSIPLAICGTLKSSSSRVFLSGTTSSAGLWAVLLDAACGDFYSFSRWASSTSCKSYMPSRTVPYQLFLLLKGTNRTED